jgi:hypothetical protein
VTMKNVTFWDVALCISCVNHLLTLVPRSRSFLHWRWRRYVLPKRRLTQDLHSDTSLDDDILETRDKLKARFTTNRQFRDLQGVLTHCRLPHQQYFPVSMPTRSKCR